jgi:hypothetical protein
MSRSTVLKLAAVGAVVYFVLMYWLSITYDPTKRRYAMPGVANSEIILRPFITLTDDCKFAVRGYVVYFKNDADNEHSRFMLYEDDRLLGPSDSTLDEITKIGMGRFVHNTQRRMSFFTFSSSDNTDPNTNGRTYWVVRQAFK